MLTVKIICCGKLKEKFYISAMSEYEKRLKTLCKFEVCELPELKLSDNPSEKEVSNILLKETEAIEKQIPQGAYVYAMCIEGLQKSSEELAVSVGNIATSGKSKICFLIGSSFGLSDKIKKLADERLSMSKMTFPHHLARVMLTEQIYRAFMINEGTKYHK